MIQFQCPACRKSYRCPERVAGTKIRCGCGRLMPVPLPLPLPLPLPDDPEPEVGGGRPRRLRLIAGIAAGALLVLGAGLYFVLRPAKNRTPEAPLSKTDDIKKTTDGSVVKKDTQSEQDRREREAAARYGGAVALMAGPNRGDDLARRGSGVLVAPDLVVTSSRAIRELAADQLRVSIGGGAGVKAVLLFEDPRLDLAVLRIPPAGVAPLQFGTQAPQPGSAAIALGYPSSAAVDNGDRIVHAQQVNVKRTDSNRVRLDQVRTPVAGGPLLNNSGEVVGIVLDLPPDDGPARRPDLAWAVPLSALRAAVEKAKPRTAADIANVATRHDRFRLFAHVAESWQFHRRCLLEAAGQAREAGKDGAALQQHLKEYRRSRSLAQEESPYESIDPSLVHQRHYDALLAEMSRLETTTDEKLTDFRTTYLKLRLLYLSPPSVTAAEFERRVLDLDNALKTQWQSALQEFAAGD
jgi:hypothetical protein